MSQYEIKNNLDDGEEKEEDDDEFAEEIEDEYVAEVEEEIEEDVENGEENEEEAASTPVKQRRCQRISQRRKTRQVRRKSGETEDGEVDEGLELKQSEEEQAEFEGEEEEEDDEGEEDEQSDIISFNSTVQSAITFLWEDEVFEFEELCDHSNIDSIYKKVYATQGKKLDSSGIFRYLEVCRMLNISPAVKVLESLLGYEIDLSYRNIHSNGIRAMCAALEVNGSVERLIMRFNKLKVVDCYYIGFILNLNEVLSYLDFCGCRIGPEGLELLITHLSKNEHITYLNLSKCDIKDRGMKLLAHVLRHNNSIKKLDVSYNKLGGESCEALAAALKINTSVTHLILRYNNLFDIVAMKALFQTLISNNSILYLDLSWNGLSDAAMARYIKVYLKKNECIQYLDISDNRFEGSAVSEIRKGLSKSTSLQTLKMGKNPIAPEELDPLLNSALASSTLKVLDLEDLWVTASFSERARDQKKISVNFAGVLGDYEIHGPDYAKVIFLRAQYEAQKPKKAKRKKDFGHLMWSLGDEPLTEQDFMARVKKFKAKINKELFPELIKQFPAPKLNMIDVLAMRLKYLTIFPDSTPPPPPKVKGKHGKGVKEEEKPAEAEEDLNYYADEVGGEEDSDFDFGGSEIQDDDEEETESEMEFDEEDLEEDEESEGDEEEEEEEDGNEDKT